MSAGLSSAFGAFIFSLTLISCKKEVEENTFQDQEKALQAEQQEAKEWEYTVEKDRDVQSDDIEQE